MDDEQQFCLKWNNHQSTLVSVFESLLRRNLLVDCTLAAEGRSMKAHKVILSACSPYFESLLGDHFDKHPVFILKDVKFKELEAMMDYMYKGEVNVSQDQLGPLLKAAESLQIKGLSDNRRDSRSTNDERRREPAAPVRDKSPPPAPTLPQVKGLVIEQKKELLLNNREGSQSPGRRKKRRRQSLDDTGNDSSIENHDGASNGSSSVSVSQPIVPPNVPLNDSRSDLTSASSLIKAKEEIMSQVPQVKQKLEPHSELMLEPKSEYIEEDMNDDSIEDLTLDDDELDMDHSRPGPSHGGQGDGSNQGFGSWQMDPSQDETFMAAQEAVGQHRDAQGKNQLQFIQLTSPFQHYAFLKIFQICNFVISHFPKIILEMHNVEINVTSTLTRFGKIVFYGSLNNTLHTTFTFCFLCLYLFDSYIDYDGRNFINTQPTLPTVGAGSRFILVDSKLGTQFM